MKYFQRIALFLFLISLLAIGSYNYFSKIGYLPKKIKSELLTSIIEKEQIIKIPSLKGKILSPSIIARKEGYLLSSLVEKKEHYRSKNWKSNEKLQKYYIALTKITEELLPTNSYQLLQPKDESGIPLFNLIQVNLISYNNEIWLFCSDEPSINKINVYAIPVKENENQFSLGKSKLIYCQNQSDSKASWSPIVFNDHIYLLSHNNPFSCVEINLTSGRSNFISKIDIDKIWQFGPIYNYCPIIQTNLGLIGFFHSTMEVSLPISKGKRFPINLLSAWSSSVEETFHIESILKRPIRSSRIDPFFINKGKIIKPYGITEKNNHLVVSSILGGNKISLIKLKTTDLFSAMMHTPVQNKEKDDQNNHL
jgi:hypothetical protein